VAFSKHLAIKEHDYRETDNWRENKQLLDSTANSSDQLQNEQNLRHITQIPIGMSGFHLFYHIGPLTLYTDGCIILILYPCKVDFSLHRLTLTN